MNTLWAGILAKVGKKLAIWLAKKEYELAKAREAKREADAIRHANDK